MRLDPSPAARLAAGVLGALSAMLARTPVAFGSVLLLVALGSITTRVSWVEILRSWWRMSLVLGLAFVGGAAGVGSQGTTLPIFGVVVTHRGLINGVLSATRIALALASARTFLLMREPGAIAQAVDWWLTPLRRVGVSTRPIGEMLGLTIELLPTLAREVGASVRSSVLRPCELGPALADVVRRVIEAEASRQRGTPRAQSRTHSRRTGVVVIILGAAALATALLRV